MRKFIYLAAIIMVLLVTGCATQNAPPYDSSYQPRKIRPTRYGDSVSWKMQGAVSIQVRDQAHMGSFTWEQIDDRYAINLSGPLNLGNIGIAGVPGRVTLNLPTRSTTASSAEELMQQQLGWYLPVSNMYYWVRGLPAPGSRAKKQRDSYGHILFLQQQGWRIRYDGYQSHGDIDLPRKIFMDNQQLRVKMVINHWNFNG